MILRMNVMNISSGRRMEYVEEKEERRMKWIE